MKTRTWLALLPAAILALFAASGTAAFADRDKDKDHGHGNGNGHWRNDKHGDQDDEDDRRGYGFGQHDRDVIRGWYSTNYRNLPPGLAKKDRLPPGLERQLVVRGALPPGLERYTYPVPVELNRELPPPPPDCDRVVIGGHIVIRNRSTNIVVDIFHLE